LRDASLTCPPGSRHGGRTAHLQPQGQEKDERAKLIEGGVTSPSSKRTCGDEDPHSDGRAAQAPGGILGAKEGAGHLHDERTNKRLLVKGAILDRETIERISTKNLKRISICRQGSKGQ